MAPSPWPLLSCSLLVPPVCCGLLLLLVAAFPVVVEATDYFDANSFGGGENTKFCPPFSCTKGFEPVPKWPLRIQSTGCNGMGGLAMFSPGEEGRVDAAEPCCHARHACYQTCGTLKSRCDETFVRCGQAACAALSSAAERESCEKNAQLHQMLVGMGGCNSFDQEQHRNCECVEQRRVRDKRARVLRNFYKKFGAEEPAAYGEKAKSLASKADTPRKMASLLLKLYSKYPNAITKLKDPQQEYLERMMKQQQKDKPSDAETTATTDQVKSADESNAEDLGTEEL